MFKLNIVTKIYDWFFSIAARAKEHKIIAVLTFLFFVMAGVTQTTDFLYRFIYAPIINLVSVDDSSSTEYFEEEYTKIKRLKLESSRKYVESVFGVPWKSVSIRGKYQKTIHANEGYFLHSIYRNGNLVFWNIIAEDESFMPTMEWLGYEVRLLDGALARIPYIPEKFAIDSHVFRGFYYYEWSLHSGRWDNKAYFAGILSRMDDEAATTGIFEANDAFDALKNSMANNENLATQQKYLKKFREGSAPNMFGIFEVGLFAKDGIDVGWSIAQHKSEISEYQLLD